MAKKANEGGELPSQWQKKAEADAEDAIAAENRQKAEKIADILEKLRNHELPKDSVLRTIALIKLGEELEEQLPSDYLFPAVPRNSWVGMTAHIFDVGRIFRKAELPGDYWLARGDDRDYKSAQLYGPKGMYRIVGTQAVGQASGLRYLVGLEWVCGLDLAENPLPPRYRTPHIAADLEHLHPLSHEDLFQHYELEEYWDNLKLAQNTNIKTVGREHLGVVQDSPGEES